MRRAAIAVAATLLLCPWATAGTTVEIRGEASVSAAVVRLGDIALVEGDEAAALEPLVVCPSPLAGQSLSLTQLRIRRRVVAALGGDAVTLRGAESCRVTRPADASQASAAGDRTAEKGQGRSLETEICEYARARLVRASGDVRFEFDPRDKDVLALTDERYRFAIRSANNEVRAGGCTVRVEACERSKPELVSRSAVIRFEVVLLEDVVVAARNIRLGQVVTAEDVRVERREFRETPGVLLHLASDVVASTAKRDLDVGQMIRIEDLKKTLMVHRGDTVTIYTYGRGFLIKTVSRALEAGEMGAAIAVQGKDGRGQFYATVTGPRTVEVRLMGCPVAPAESRGPSGEATVAAASVVVETPGTVEKGGR